MRSRLAAIALGLLTACGPAPTPSNGPVASSTRVQSPSASATSAGPTKVATIPRRMFLNVHNRGGSTVRVWLNGELRANVGCLDTVDLEPAMNGLPDLPWQLEIRAADGWLITRQAIGAAALPSWLWVMGGHAFVQARDYPITGPYVPCPTTPPGRVDLPAIALPRPTTLCAGVGLAVSEFRADIARRTVYAAGQGGQRIDLRWAPGFTALLEPEVDVFDPLGIEVVHAGRPLGEVGVCPDTGGVARYVVAEIGARRYWP